MHGEHDQSFVDVLNSVTLPSALDFDANAFEFEQNIGNPSRSRQPTAPAPAADSEAVPQRLARAWSRMCG